MSRRVLVVEDDDGTRALLIQALRDEGFDPVGAPNGRAALDLLDGDGCDQSEPELVVLDLQMPVMDGASFARAYRERSVAPAPILLLTAGRPSPEQLAEIGAASFVSKPFDLDALFGSVRDALGDRSPMRVLLIEDSDADSRLVAEVLKELPGVELEVAHDGPTGLRAIDQASTAGAHHALVLLDLGLPYLDGFSVLESIKRAESHRRLPAVVITASDDGEHVLRAYDLRANGYVVKSGDLDTMRERIKGIVRFWQLARLPSHVASQ